MHFNPNTYDNYFSLISKCKFKVQKLHFNLIPNGEIYLSSQSYQQHSNNKCLFIKHKIINHHFDYFNQQKTINMITPHMGILLHQKRELHI